jgi:DNA-binding response OmpR family regulator
MANILIVDSDLPHAEALGWALHRRGHKVKIADPCCAQLTRIVEPCLVDIVVLDVTQLKDEGWRELRQICQLCTQDKLPIQVLCCSRVYRGPRFELDIEQLGARFVYER